MPLAGPVREQPHFVLGPKGSCHERGLSTPSRRRRAMGAPACGAKRGAPFAATRERTRRLADTVPGALESKSQSVDERVAGHLATLLPLKAGSRVARGAWAATAPASASVAEALRRPAPAGAQRADPLSPMAAREHPWAATRRAPWGARQQREFRGRTKGRTGCGLDISSPRR